jgi:hypothetical protein
MKVLVAVALVSLVTLAGCGGSDTQSTSVDCNAGSNTAPEITAYNSTASLPVATGLAAGQAILDGTYYRTATTYYGQANNLARSPKMQGTLVIAGNTIKNIERQPAPDPEFRVGGTFSIGGTTLSFSVTCTTDATMVGQTISAPFSYANGVLKVHDTDINRENVFTRQ